jgi:haloacetate dehalogenase
MFDGFEEAMYHLTPEVIIRARHGGSGPPVVLLHGHPRTHTTWHRVAPLLAEGGFTVVCPDLRGYGKSSKPPTTADHSTYSKRALAGDILALMQQLGHEQFAVVGHDRGSYVAFRLALDAPEAVTALAVLDSVPIGEALARADACFAQAWWHWFFFAQPEKPENAILADPATVRAMLEDYRAGLGVDRAADDADRTARRRITCPTLVLWSTRDDMERLYGDVLAVWRNWTDDLRGGPIESGHHMAEDAPDDLATRLIDFLRDVASGNSPIPRTAPF